MICAGAVTVHAFTGSASLRLLAGSVEPQGTGVRGLKFVILADSATGVRRISMLACW